ncbi:GMC family oxidoreductase [Histidinibacterium aquaticum]|uniref:Choline dehydrogenase n=1 Tax=Histidinibacterium aquaticum TaxID=2613962 RepID=A0A5J5GQJ5_9RHOB|nr:choline dehydrogenase [Histidinibacterium aquaticum]KAA9010033.1 choline dehydrogenase [Histidinibacterium aquaticum]
MTSKTTYDYIIAGGGSAGCVLAARLSESGAEVLLLEAGYGDSHPLIHVPAGFTKLSGPRVNWGYSTVPQKHLDNREMWYPQGKTLGGGSSINAMIYTRGHRADYDEWSELGAEGWSYAEVLPYFRKAEDNARLCNAYHGVGGPLRVSDPISPLPITATFIKAAQQAGLPYSHDFNGAEQEGVGYHQTTTRDGRRGSAAVSYLRPARKRKNLTVLTRMQVRRILIEKGRATGVEYRSHKGQPGTAHARKEVIVTAGAIGSPKLMMLSGLGPAAHLKEHGIEVKANIAGVGENLQDHLDCYTVYDMNGPHSYNGSDQYIRQAGWALQYLLYKNGPVTTNIVEAGAFARVDPKYDRPDIQLHFLPAYVVDHGMMRIKGYGVSLYSNLLRPRSRGTVRLSSDRVEDAPLIDPNYLADPYDRKMAIEGLKLAREVMNQPAFSDFVARERMPGPDVQTDEDLAAYVRQWAKTDYHPVGTCKMGTDPMSVVSPELKVHGIEGLRVCDSSVMPTEISANTNAPTIMIAEKAADMILGRSPEPKETFHERPAH